MTPHSEVHNVRTGSYEVRGKGYAVDRDDPIRSPGSKHALRMLIRGHKRVYEANTGGYTQFISASSS